MKTGWGSGVGPRNGRGVKLPSSSIDQFFSFAIGQAYFSRRPHFEMTFGFTILALVHIGSSLTILNFPSNYAIASHFEFEYLN